MTKYLLTGAAAFAMMTGIAQAQMSTDTTTKSTTITSAPNVGAYSSTKTQQTIDSSGTETNKTQSYGSDSNGTSSKSSTTVTAPSGAQNTTTTTTTTGR